MTLTTDFTWYDLPLETPFGIARGTATTAGTVVVTVEDESGTVGVGGGAPAAYYGEDRETVADVLPDLCSAVETVGDPQQGQRVAHRLRAVAGGPAAHPAARSAVSTALADLVCRRLDLPLYRYLGLDPARTRTSSYTIGIAETDRMAERAAAAVDAGFAVLKVKLGTDRDEAIVRAVRDAVPEATLRVDANGAWDAEEAVALTQVLAEESVEFVEQPVPADDVAGLARVREAGAVPVAVDESCPTAAEVPPVASADACDIVVVKLDKCGGVRPALAQVATARAHGLDVMLGCMTGSDAAIAPAVHLTPLVDHVDLDGALLLAEDPYDGIAMPGGRIDLTTVDRPGTGVRRG
jgi:L-alanine-DL-glutamate epimerase-like enolase superfamily enzyme